MATVVSADSQDTSELETDVTVVVPVRDEEKNIPPLLEMLHQVADVRNEPFKILFIDDSRHPDGAPNADGIVASDRMSQVLCDGSCKHLRIEHILRTRDGKEPEGGLAGAVMDGIAAASTTYAVVMDGDLQHPPEFIPNMLARIRQGFDIVPASRYVPGGSSAGLSGPIRHFVSRASTLAARLLFPYTLRGIKDPMTGFFVVRRGAILASKRKPQGFKVLFHLLHANKHFRRSEVPFVFAKREHGESKGDMRQGLTFLKQLMEHRIMIR